MPTCISMSALNNLPDAICRLYSTSWTLLKIHLFSLFIETPSLVTLYTVQCHSSDYNDLQISYKFAVYVTVYIDSHYVTLLMTGGIFDDDDNH